MFMKALQHGIATAVVISGVSTGRSMKRIDLFSF